LLNLIRGVILFAVATGVILLYRKMGMDFVYGAGFMFILLQADHKVRTGKWIDV